MTTTTTRPQLAPDRAPLAPARGILLGMFLGGACWVPVVAGVGRMVGAW